MLGCAYFNQGKGSCLKGDKCTFSHDPKLEVARMPKGKGKAKERALAHVLPRLLDETPLEEVRLLEGPARGVLTYNKYKTKPCINFANGNCTFGDRCKFKHNG